MTITFVASITGTSCIRFDSDGAGVVKLSIPATELAEVAKLLTCREQALRITVETQEDARC
jgi:hypothetical protein